MKQVLLIEFNEINFESIESYISKGYLPAFASLIQDYGYSRTVSENKYEELEPWIQWVSAHTGKTLQEHQVFRLGDIVKHEITQIWEKLENRNIKVGAVSPMNAKNRTNNAAFFIPDPWTSTTVTGSFLLKRIYKAISQAVNDNAQGKLKINSLLWLLIGVATNARVVNYSEYLNLFMKIKRNSWAKAMFLDLLLTDLFINLTRQTKPNFATLFLNAGAHIQHHYMFSSATYDGPNNNPDWYVDADTDPLLDVYSLYDRILGQIRKAFPQARLMIATGLHQDPHEELTYYWRLKDHAAFLRNLKISFVRVEPRMSRDFLVSFDSIEDACAAEVKFKGIRSTDGLHLFKIDNRGDDLFVTLVYSKFIDDSFAYTVDGKL
ncbi:MAG: hypothetical protein MJA83_10620, partial [Gammaproteobacteria bacterium]|nr:hypothetical protein [Gammaproteobacteria bacterium]